MLVDKVDVQGHRGCRGLMPENTIPAFLKALEIGVHTLELDVVVSGDNQVIVSHEPYFSHHISIDPMGRNITAEDEHLHNIFQMSVSDIQQYDVGSRVHPNFPDQIKLKTYKPTLSEVFDQSEKWIADHQLPTVQYNVEIKRKPEYDGVYHPGVKEFVNRVVEVVKDHRLGKKVIIQSFDVETLEALHVLVPDWSLAYLVEEGIPDQNLNKLSFVPAIYSPYFKLLDAASMDELKRMNIEVIPWTVNERTDISAMLKLGVDGIISDYPNRVFDIIKNTRS